MPSAPGRLGWLLIGLGVVATALIVILIRVLPGTPEPVGEPLDLAGAGTELRSVTVYYLSADSLAILPEERQVLVRPSRRASAEDLIELLTLPTEGLRPPLPESTALLHFFESEDGLVLDFNAAMESTSGRSILEDRLRLSAVVRTLVENLGPAENLRLLVHGRPLTRWGDHLALDPVIRTEAWR